MVRGLRKQKITWVQLRGSHEERAPWTTCCRPPPSKGRDKEKGWKEKESLLACFRKKKNRRFLLVLKAEMATEEKEIHMLIQYSHMYLPYTPWIISETWKFEKRKGGGWVWECNFSWGEKSIFKSKWISGSFQLTFCVASLQDDSQWQWPSCSLLPNCIRDGLGDQYNMAEVMVGYFWD